MKRSTHAHSALIQNRQFRESHCTQRMWSFQRIREKISRVPLSHAASKTDIPETTHRYGKLPESGEEAQHPKKLHGCNRGSTIDLKKVRERGC